MYQELKTSIITHRSQSFTPKTNHDHRHTPAYSSYRVLVFIGVDLSECLQYPDFSVVVLYKKVVVGFGFMVPDVKYNEAYISFLLVHPEWRRAGIATFMIYHLIQASRSTTSHRARRQGRHIKSGSGSDLAVRNLSALAPICICTPFKQSQTYICKNEY